MIRWIWTGYCILLATALAAYQLYRDIIPFWPTISVSFGFALAALVLLLFTRSRDSGGFVSGSEAGGGVPDISGKDGGNGDLGMGDS